MFGAAVFAGMFLIGVVVVASLIEPLFGAFVCGFFVAAIWKEWR